MRVERRPQSYQHIHHSHHLSSLQKVGDHSPCSGGQPTVPPTLRRSCWVDAASFHHKTQHPTGSLSFEMLRLDGKPWWPWKAPPDLSNQRTHKSKPGEISCFISQC